MQEEQSFPSRRIHNSQAATFFGFPNFLLPINKPGPIEKNIQATVTIHALGFKLLLLIIIFLCPAKIPAKAPTI